MRRRQRFLDPELAADEREQYRREALAEARADREAQEHGYNSDEEYQAALVWDEGDDR